jgi:hypothetical protein
MENERNYPTMIIPRGTEISVNEHGLLSIKTPGNLVIQNPGVYSMIECANGSVRIDPAITVEAISINAADSCLIAGTLTAWRVKAKKIILEKGAQAFIMLQEAESLELDKSARLVGNFASEQELYLMLGRFRRQLRELPQSTSGGPAGPVELPNSAEPFLGSGAPSPLPIEGFAEPFTPMEPDKSPRQEQIEALSLAQIILEREERRLTLTGPRREALAQLLALINTRQVEGLTREYRELFARIEPLNEELARVRNILARVLNPA